MTWRILRRKSNKLLRRTFHKKNKKFYVPAFAILLGFVFIKMYMPPQPTQVDPQSYAPLLSTIAKGESKGNYNAYFGNATNTEINFTSMTVAEVMRWQEDYVRNGSASSAVGKYQIIRPTLNGLVRQLNINQQDIFNEALQDKMAIELLERRGSIDFVSNKISRDQFAANIAQEWAALPKIIGDNPNQSYYAGDGLNKAHINTDEILTAVQQLKKLE